MGEVVLVDVENVVVSEIKHGEFSFDVEKYNFSEIKQGAVSIDVEEDDVAEIKQEEVSTFVEKEDDSDDVLVDNPQKNQEVVSIGETDNEVPAIQLIKHE